MKSKEYYQHNLIIQLKKWLRHNQPPINAYDDYLIRSSYFEFCNNKLPDVYWNKELLYGNRNLVSEFNEFIKTIKNNK